jgi:hypothetical protein
MAFLWEKCQQPGWFYMRRNAGTMHALISKVIRSPATPLKMTANKLQRLGRNVAAFIERCLVSLQLPNPGTF